MNTPSTQLGRRLGGLGVWTALGVIAALVVPAHGQPAANTSADTNTPTIHVAGPLLAREMVEELAAEFGKNGSAVAVDYLRVESAGAAAGLLVSGREMILTLGRVTDKDLAASRDRWRALAPQEQTVGARAVAIVVHVRNGVDTLTINQLQAIYSARAADWKVVGGEAKPIRRYALPAGDPLSSLFHDKVLSTGKCNMLLRKKDSADALAALAGDPQAIAFVDAVPALAAGGTVKIIGVGEGKTAVLPNAQTIKDGSYELSQTVVLYVSPKASATASRFAQYILAGQGDAICRRHGLIPTLRPARADAIAAFKKLYGADIERVKATAEASDDIALAEQILDSARTGKLDKDLLATMCAAAYDLAFNVSGGDTLAFVILRVWADKAPDARFECAIRTAALCERAYTADKLRANVDRLIDALMSAGDLGTSAHRFAEAADAWTRAVDVAEEVNSPKLAALKERLPAFTARRDILKEVDRVTAQWRENPQSPVYRGWMLKTYLLELDNPAEAAKFVDAGSPETIKTNLPLATEPVDKLSEDSALLLAEWYAGMVGNADAGGKELIATRARGYYARFFAQHKDRDDALATRATLGMRKVNGQVPPPELAATASGGQKPAPAKPAGAVASSPLAETTDLRLAEFVAANPEVTRLGRQEIGSARRLTDLRPLARLSKLTALELADAENLRDLSPLSKLTGLKALVLTGLGSDSLAGLAGLSSVTTLDLTGAGNIVDLSPISRLTQLRTLNLTGCCVCEPTARPGRADGRGDLRR